jgi:NitT/TauT family transport system ATP-binding protein
VSTAFTCDRLTHRFPRRGGGDLVTLRDVTFDVGDGEFVSIVGPSGCGKTTLLRIIAGLLRASSGSIRFPSNGAERGPRDTGLVFQEHGVFPWMTVIENVAFGLEMQGVASGERRERARSFIDRVGLSAFASSYPHELSVGMRQRVGIARAFVSGRPILLMDEPFGALDAQTKIVLQEELLRLWRDDRKVVVFVTHDIEEAVRLGDRVLVMSGRPGTIREEIVVPHARPRDLARRQAGVAELADRIWTLLEEEVRSGLLVRAE